MEATPRTNDGRERKSMTTTPDPILDALKACAVQLRNMETYTQGREVSVSYANEYDEYLSLVIRLASNMHLKTREALVKNATRVLMEYGYEVKSPQQ